MDQLTPAEKAEVEGYLKTYPELMTDLYEIGRSLELVAMSAARPAPSGLKDKILNDIRNSAPKDSPQTNTKVQSGFGALHAIAALLGLGVLFFGYMFWQKNTALNTLQGDYTVLRDNKIIPFQATPGFASTDLYLHYNAVTKRNFIQVRNLPSLAANQSFQLWSLKPDQAPAPHTVFEIPSNGLIEVAFEAGTDTYAITIEPKGGRETPTLENLIGTVSVAGI